MNIKKTSVLCLFALLFVLVLTGFTYAGINDGLAGYWSFDDQANLGLDTSENNNNGVPASGYVSYSSEGIIGGAAKFVAGSNAGITIPNNGSLNFTNGITIAAWVKLDYIDGHATVISKSDSWSNEPYALWASFYHFSGRFGAFFSGASRSDDSGFSLSPGEWTHIAMTYDGQDSGFIKFYVNGILINFMRSYAHGIATNSSALHIGASPCPGPEDFSGLMDEVRLYNRALLGSEISQLYILPNDSYAADCEQENAIDNGNNCSSQTGSRCCCWCPDPTGGHAFGHVMDTGEVFSNVDVSLVVRPGAGDASCVTTGYMYYSLDGSSWTPFWSKDNLHGWSSYSDVIKINDSFRYIRANTDGCSIDYTNVSVVISQDSMNFTFTPITSPKFVGAPFLAGLRALDRYGRVMSNFSGYVELTSTLGPVTPTRPYLQYGSAVFEVTMYNQGYGQLIADGRGARDYSNSFTVQGSGSCQASICGRVVNNSGQPISGAMVNIYDHDGNPVGDICAITDENGRFCIPNMACDAYELRVLAGTTVKAGIRARVAGTLPITLPDIKMTVARAKDTPVVLVPGMMGSTTRSQRYPSLAGDLSDLEIYDWYEKRTGFNKLRDTLEAQEFTVIDCPWDWRKPTYQAYKTYLMPAIQEALTYSRTGKVHIVAHSMGGLLVREYIQSTDYEGDIDKFAMVGTPNLGSCNPYYIWEGGDPKLLDDITDSGITSWVNPYTNVIKGLWEDVYHMKHWDEDDHKHIRSFVRDNGVSMLQLMSTDDFLINSGYDHSCTTGDNWNEWLDELNDDDDISALMSDGSDGTDLKVHVGLFVGERSSSTIGRIFVGDPNSLYEDGKPRWPEKSYAFMDSGDGTVPYESATYPYTQGWAKAPLKTSAEHIQLVKAFTENNALINFLNGVEPSARAILPRASADESASGLYVSLFGAMRCYVTSPGGQHAGINPTNRAPAYEIAGAKFTFGLDGGTLNIDDPVNGTYTVTIFGEGQRDYSIEVGYSDATRSDISRYRGFVPGQPMSFTVTVNSTATPRITVTPAVPSPGSLRSESYTSGSSTLTRLRWNSVSGIIGYNIYSAGGTDPYYAYMDTVPAGTAYFNTTDAWSTSDAIPVKTYAVSAVRADGTESFFSNEAQNKPSRCECDLNSDGRCDMRDWLLFGQRWGASDCNTVYCACDLNADGRCDMRDWLLFGKSWGRTDCPIQ